MVKNTVVMTPAEATSNPETRPRSIGPGDRLQAARMEKGMTVEDVANRMHLSVAIVESIEENTFEDITAPIFVKGYLRAYARIVSLSEEEMIQQYLEFYSDEDPPINSTSNTSPEISLDDARIKWTTFLVILVLCGLLAAWWWSKNQDKGEVVSLAVEQSEANVDIEPVEENISAEPEIQASSDGANSINNETAEIEEAKTDAEIVTLESVVTGQDDIALSEPEIEVEVEQAMVNEAGLETNSVESSQSEGDTGSISRTADTGSDQLIIKVHADTWADIKDANGHRLAYDLLRADRQWSLVGQAPFTVFFGNGHGVELHLNSEEIDITSHTRDDNTARLTIGSH